jgi:hypothetical protein
MPASPEVEPNDKEDVHVLRMLAASEERCRRISAYAIENNFDDVVGKNAATVVLLNRAIHLGQEF